MGSWRALTAVCVAGALILAWLAWPESDDRAIRGRLAALADEANNTAGDGLGSVSRAARLGSYFTEDAVIDPGGGATPVSGRDTVVAMAIRFQPSNAGVISVQDVVVARRRGTAIADVALTAMITGRDPRTGERTVDAREFALEMRKESGAWLIARASAVDTLR